MSRKLEDHRYWLDSKYFILFSFHNGLFRSTLYPQIKFLLRFYIHKRLGCNGGGTLQYCARSSSRNVRLSHMVRNSFESPRSSREFARNQRRRTRTQSCPKFLQIEKMVPCRKLSFNMMETWICFESWVSSQANQVMKARKSTWVSAQVKEVMKARKTLKVPTTI